MGTVYELRHPQIDKQLALKVLNAEFAARPDIAKRFFKEAVSATKVDHPNIINVVDFATLPDGRPYIVMEYLNGNSLADEIKQFGKLDLGLIQIVLLDLCSALQAAHEQGIVHRDLKPGNIQFENLQGGIRRIKVLDFGIAKLQIDTNRQTRSGVVIGTPRYMSPEQAMGKTREVDHRTDIYALGVIAYQMIAGVVPFDGQTFGELLLQHSNEPPPPLSKYRPDISPAWEVIVRRALEKKKENRFASMRAFSDAVRDASIAPVTKASPHDDTVTIPSAIGGSSHPKTFDESRNNKEAISNPRAYLVTLGVVFALGVALLIVWAMTSGGDTELATPQNGGSSSNVSRASTVPAITSSSTTSSASLVPASTSSLSSSSTSSSSSSRKTSTRYVRVKLCASPWGVAALSGTTLGEITCVHRKLTKGKRYTFSATNRGARKSTTFVAKTRGQTVQLKF